MMYFDEDFGYYYHDGPRVNAWYDEKEGYTLEMLIPGVDKKDVKVSLIDDDTLEIGVQGTTSTASKDAIWYRHDFSLNSIKQQIGVPDNTDRENIKATIENGILTIKLPKKKESKTEITIE